MLTLLGIQTMEEDPAWRNRELDRLLTQVGEGDREALAEVYHRARASVYALALSLLKDAHEAEDAVQDTFLRALRAWPGFRGDCAVETWLVRIAINVCKRQLRSPWRLLRAPQESLDSLRMEGPEPPDDTLVRAIQALPPKYREVIILYYYQEWKAWEIAQRLHVPVSTVTVRLSRARGLLRERLKGWYYEQE